MVYAFHSKKRTLRKGARMSEPKVYTREEIDGILRVSDRAVERGILRLYSLQTSSEQSSGETREANGVGFSGAYSRSGTYYAKWLNSGRNLTGKHLDKAREICLRHSRQLVDFANQTKG